MLKVNENGHDRSHLTRIITWEIILSPNAATTCPQHSPKPSGWPIWNTKGQSTSNCASSAIPFMLQNSPLIKPRIDFTWDHRSNQCPFLFCFCLCYRLFLKSILSPSHISWTFAWVSVSGKPNLRQTELDIQIILLPIIPLQLLICPMTLQSRCCNFHFINK
jgi:hypothetical protein